MSANRFLPHLLVLPEDDANRQVANGFLLGFPSTQIQVLRPAGGWLRTRDLFVSEHLYGLRSYGARHVAMLVDFDNHPNRRDEIMADVPHDLRDRVYIIGSLADPESLRQVSGLSYEQIGRSLAADCREGTRHTWANSLLQHNETELVRISAICATLLPKGGEAVP